MSLIIFKRWLDKLNLKMKNENRKILLTLDNAPVHPVILSYSNVELLFYPPNVTSWIQPLDKGIIKTFKSHYKRKLNLKINFGLEKNTNDNYNDEIKKFRLIDSLKLILES
ncbi:Tigger transposable element-derived protein 1 [Dictyocoela muelleri]|nr:Tigger transposable element-derived protein 1 [Dictyocoela muelleri]